MKLAQIFFAAWIAVTLLGSAGAKAQTLTPAPEGLPAVTLLKDGVVLEWSASQPSVTANSAGEVTVQVPGFNLDQDPGNFPLPYNSVLVALPPTGSPKLEVTQIETQSIQLPGALVRNPVANSTTITSTLDQTVQSGPLTFEEIGSMRGVRLARVTFRPALDAQGNLKYTSSIRAVIHFQVDAPQNQAIQDPMVRAIQKDVINPEQVAEPTSGIAPTAIAPAAASPTTAIIEVSQSGIIQVTYEELSAVNFPVDTINPATLHLTHNGAEVAFTWTSAKRGEVLRFYAQPFFYRWSSTDTYLLADLGTPGGLSIGTRSASPTGLSAVSPKAEATFDQNLLYTPDCLGCGMLAKGRDGDWWTWLQLPRLDNGSTTDQVNFTVANVDPNQPATLTSWWIGWTDIAAVSPDHQVNISLNGTFLGAITWDGKDKYSPSVFTLTIPARVLISGNNTLSFVMPALPGVTLDQVRLDSFKVNYSLGPADMSGEMKFSGYGATTHSYPLNLSDINNQQVYDISSPSNPVLLTEYGKSGNTLTIGDTGSSFPATYLVTSTVRAPALVRLKQPLNTASTTTADYIIISADGYSSALSSLVALRQSQGLKVVSENLQAIYDTEYNNNGIKYSSYGRMDPEAIHQYLLQAYQNWSPKPQYVLLVGDGTVDPKRYLSNSFATVLPPMLIVSDATADKNADPYTMESTADNRYVVLHTGTDNLPDMAIGRLPANSPAEAAAMVDKIVHYETTPAAGLWKGQSLFVADAGSNFSAISQRVSQNIPGPYFTPTNLLYKVNITTADQMRASIINTWNKGTGLVVFTGHAAIVLWGIDSYFHIDNLPSLINGNKLPFVLELTCFTGGFQTPGLDTLDEALVRKSNGGAIAALGSTSQGIAGGQEYLANGFLKSIIHDHPGQLGLAVYAGKLAISTNKPSNAYMIDSYILFGDPASHLALNFTADHGIFVPLVKK